MRPKRHAYTTAIRSYGFIAPLLCHRHNCCHVTGLVSSLPDEVAPETTHNICLCFKCRVPADFNHAALSGRSAAVNKYLTRHTAIETQGTDKEGSQGFARIETGASLGQKSRPSPCTRQPHSVTHAPRTTGAATSDRSLGPHLEVPR